MTDGTCYGCCLRRHNPAPAGRPAIRPALDGDRRTAPSGRRQAAGSVVGSAQHGVHGEAGPAPPGRRSRPPGSASAAAVHTGSVQPRRLPLREMTSAASEPTWNSAPRPRRGGASRSSAQGDAPGRPRPAPRRRVDGEPDLDDLGARHGRREVAVGVEPLAEVDEAAGGDEQRGERDEGGDEFVLHTVLRADRPAG